MTTQIARITADGAGWKYLGAEIVSLRQANGSMFTATPTRSPSC